MTFTSDELLSLFQAIDRRLDYIEAHLPPCEAAPIQPVRKKVLAKVLLFPIHGTTGAMVRPG